MAQNFTELANFVWSVADILRGDYKQADSGKVILPFPARCFRPLPQLAGDEVAP